MSRELIALERIAQALELLAGMKLPVDEVAEDNLQVRANSNRENAGRLFGEHIFQYEFGKWCERSTGLPVVFTPYGWIVDPNTEQKEDQ
jgi:hypothetical protein